MKGFIRFGSATAVGGLALWTICVPFGQAEPAPVSGLQVKFENERVRVLELRLKPGEREKAAYTPTVCPLRAHGLSGSEYQRRWHRSRIRSQSGGCLLGRTHHAQWREHRHNGSSSAHCGAQDS